MSRFMRWLRSLFKMLPSKDYIAFEFIQTEVRRICDDPTMTMQQCLAWLRKKPGKGRL